MSTTSDRSSAVEGRLKPSFLLLVYANAFITGAVVMGFEMLGSRYLNPFFGSGIYTWAALISTVLAALTAGYFFGGWMADRKPTPAGLGWLIVGGSAYLGVIPLFADGMLDGLATLLGALGDQHEFERWGSIAGAMLLLFVPLALLGVYSPYAIRLTLRATARSGTVAGRIYGVSTLGSIFGTLFVTFYLIPTMGSRHITYLLAAIGLAAGFSFVLHAWRSARMQARVAVAGALLLAVAAGLAQQAAFAEAPDGRAVPAQASPDAKEAGERFLAYLRKQGAEIRQGAIAAGPGPTGFRIENLVVADGKTEFRIASIEAAAFAERDNGEAVLTGVTIVDLEAREGEKTTFTGSRLAAESLTWSYRLREPRLAARGVALRDIAIMPPAGEIVRVASIDVAGLRVDSSTGGGVHGLAIRTVTVANKDETGSIGAIDIESIAAEIPARIAIKGVALRDLVANIAAQGTIRAAAVELRQFESVNLFDRNPADLRVLDFAIKGLEAPLSGSKDPGFEREMRELGYAVLKIGAELVYRYEAATTTFNLAKLELDVADMASFTIALKISGLSPEDIKKSLEPPPTPPGQVPNRDARQGALAVALLARLSLVSADISFRDKSILGRVLKRQAQKLQIDEAAVRAQYRAVVTAMRDEQTDPLVREALDAVIAFIDDPGELLVEIRPPAPLNLMAASALFATNPAQLWSMLGFKIVAKKP